VIFFLRPFLDVDTDGQHSTPLCQCLAHCYRGTHDNGDEARGRDGRGRWRSGFLWLQWRL